MHYTPLFLLKMIGRSTYTNWMLGLSIRSRRGHRGRTIIVFKSLFSLDIESGRVCHIFGGRRNSDLEMAKKNHFQTADLRIHMTQIGNCKRVNKLRASIHDNK